MENNTADKKMQGRIATIDELLEKDCYIIDFLPETVSKDSNGQFFDVEDYWLNSQKYHMIKDHILYQYFHIPHLTVLFVYIIF